MGDERIYQQTVKPAGEKPAEKNALKPLSPAEEAKVRRRMQLIGQYMPDFRDFVIGCLQGDMLDGWRNIELVEIFETGEVV